MLVLVHLDALIIIGRVLYDVNLLRLSELGDLSFSLPFVCASYELDVCMSFELLISIFTGELVFFFL